MSPSYQNSFSGTDCNTKSWEGKKKGTFFLKDDSVHGQKDF